MLTDHVLLNRSEERQPADVLHFYDMLSINTGWEQSPEQWREGSDRYKTLHKQTARMANALERQGISARIDEGDIVDFGEVTGEVSRAEAFRPIRFLPLIAQRERRPMLNQLRYFQRHHSLGKNMRYAVVTFGKRIPCYGDLREVIQKGHRNISRWAHEADRDWNVSVVFRGTEFTVDDDLTFHPHANVLYAPRRLMSKQRWSAFLQWTQRRLGGAHWQDCGRLEKPDEAIKYPFKPGDADRLDDPALAWLYHATERLKMAVPMREFAEFRDGLNRDRQKIVMVNCPGGAQLLRVRKPKRGESEPGAPCEGIQENVLLFRTSPQFRFGPYAQPVTRILNYTENPTTADGQRRLEALKERRREARKCWDDNGAPSPEIAMAVARGQAEAMPGEEGKVAAFKVHTCRSTVQDNQSDLFDHGSSPPSDRSVTLLSTVEGDLIDAETGEIIFDNQIDLEARNEVRASVAAKSLADGIEAMQVAMDEADRWRQFQKIMEEKSSR